MIDLRSHSPKIAVPGIGSQVGAAYGNEVDPKRIRHKQFVSEFQLLLPQLNDGG